MKKLLIATIVTFASLHVLAESSDTTIHPLDADKDGQISKEEASVDTTLSAIFAELDIDQDGFLSPSELAVKTKDLSH
ncbi:hypothetical protein [uncultured Paraglaciecola sp.]|uniref:hypothetical protein n=1 Tax=uncultured Paraglaciecola sp. TaxID=1765024 RepID=UPI0025CE9386|nr:hypothetical protein [uncultured Paraglaciecola sp.]